MHLKTAFLMLAMSVAILTTGSDEAFAEPRSDYVFVKMERDCPVIQADFYQGRACTGMGGYDVVYNDDKHGYLVFVPSGQSAGYLQTRDRYQEIQGGSFAIMFKNAEDISAIEFRGSGTGTNWTPYAAIVRMSEFRDQNYDHNALHIVKLSPDRTCPIASVGGDISGHNEIARRIADEHAMTWNCDVDRLFQY